MILQPSDQSANLVYLCLVKPLPVTVQVQHLGTDLNQTSYPQQLTRMARKTLPAGADLKLV